MNRLVRRVRNLERKRADRVGGVLFVVANYPINEADLDEEIRRAEKCGVPVERNSLLLSIEHEQMTAEVWVKRWGDSMEERGS